MRAWFAGLLLALGCMAQSAGIVIAQQTESHAAEADEQRMLLQYMAEALDEDGRLNPIAWTITDPIFRSAVQSNLVKESPNPDLQTVLAGAEKLKADYVLICTVFRKDTELYGRLRLFKKGQEIWRDPAVAEKANDGARILTVQSNGRFDLSNSLRGAASTWTQLMFADPLKGLAPRQRIETPPVDPGVKPDIPDAPPPTKVDNRELMTQVMKLLATSKTAEAVALLRDAVDAEPLDAERRKALANALATAGMNETAAGEARRAAELFPEQADLRTQAARFWMAAGKIDEANVDLNEAVARNPESVETRMLLGEVALSKLQIDAAMTHLDFVLSKAPTADAHFKRSLARAMNDDSEGSKKDLDEAVRLGLGKDPLEVRTQYATAIRVSEAALSEVTEAMRTLFQRARANFGNKEVRDDRKVLASRCQGLVALFGVLGVPPVHKNSQGRLVLALKLLDQALSELGSYLDSGTDDVMGDATITLGEAVKALAAASEAYRAELAHG